MRQVSTSCVVAGVAIGAQVGYRDLVGFGRRFIDVDPVVLADDVLYQLGALDAVARSVGGRVAYVKPHGALYNAIVEHEEQAAAVVAAVRSFEPGMAALGLPGSRWLALAEAAGLRPVPEAFADRAYTPDGTLVSRRVPGAVLHDPDEIAARSVRLATDAEIVAVDGSTIPVAAESLCVHGDTAGAVTIAARVRTALAEAGVPVSAFTGRE